MDTFRKVMKIDQVKYLSRTEKTTRVHEALWWMSYDCRFCGVGKWYCKCQWDSEEEEGESDASWMTDGSEWETDTEDEVEQDEVLSEMLFSVNCGMPRPGNRKKAGVAKKKSRTRAGSLARGALRARKP